MKSLIGTIGAAIGLLALAALFFGHALLVYPGWDEIAQVLKPFDAAAWVQAVGSILAILAAGFFVRWQHDLEQESNRRAERELRRRKLDVVVELARATSHSIGYIRDYFPSRQAVHEIALGARFFDRRVVESLGVHLGEIPLYELDDAVLVNEILVLRVNSQHMRDVVARLLERHRHMDGEAFGAAFAALADCANAANQGYEVIRGRADVLVPRDSV
ncbi:hypothetical protein [Variovorax sp. V15]|uniref:hypothetical protein n=1 Tax=Variovorax sp. V15 TaxID=3065952 RepID=UPI0034E89926